MKTLVKTIIALAVAATFFGADAASADDMQTWQREVVKKVSKSQTYPRSALAREIEGRAKIRLVVAADGQITESEVVEPTGEALLDNEIPKLLERLNPLPALPDGRENLTFVLPLTWTLE